MKYEELNEEEVKRLMRRVFSTEDGKKVFNIILTDLYYFDLVRNDKEVTLQNFAKYFVNERLGIKDTVAISNFMLKVEG